jgi:hypothetical protein
VRPSAKSAIYDKPEALIFSTERNTFRLEQ